MLFKCLSIFVVVLIIRRHEMKNVAGDIVFLYKRYLILDEQALIQDEDRKLFLAYCKIF